MVPIGFEQNMQIERGYQTAVSDFEIVYKYDNWEKIIIKFFPKIFKDFFLIFKKTEYTYKNTCRYMCTKFLVAILKNGWVLPFCMPQKATFYAIHEDFGIVQIFNFCRIWAVQKVF